MGEANRKEVLCTCPVRPWLMYDWFKLLEHHAMTVKELVSAFPYLLTCSNMALKIFVQYSKRQCNSLFMVMPQPWANKWASLTCINNCKINCSRGDSESHSCFSVFVDHREIRSSTSRSITSSGCLLFMQHESCHRGTFSSLKAT